MKTVRCSQPPTQINATIKNGILLFLLLWYSLPSFTQQKYFNFHQINIDNGLANNTVYELMQDDHGFIWIGAGTKVQRFDGSRFVNFDNTEYQNIPIPAGEIRCIFKDSKGYYWIGSDGGGLVRFKEGEFNTYEASESAGSLSNNVVEHIIEMPDGSLYMATWGGGINIFKDGIFTQIKNDPKNDSSLPNDQVVDLFYDNQTQILWVGTWDGGLCTIHDGKVTRFPRSSAGFNSNRARSIEKTPDGSIWIGTWGDGLFRYLNGQFTHYSKESGDLQNNNILSLSIHGNNLWIGTWGGGVTLYENQKFTTFRHQINHTNTICSDFVESSMVDNNGNLWIGTFGGGISRFQKSQFHYFPELSQNSKNPNSQFIKTIEEDNNGKIWIAGEPGLYVQQNHNFKPVSDVYPDFPDIGLIYTLEKDKFGHMWIGGGTGVGLYLFDGHKLHDRSVWPNVDFHQYFIHDIMCAKDGSVWISGEIDAGLIHIKGDTVERFFHDPDNDQTVSINNFYNTLEASDGTIWISTSKNGLSRYKNGIFHNYLHNPSDKNSISSNYVNAIVETKTGQIWIATLRGLNLYNPETDGFEVFPMINSQGESNILSIIEDHNGDLWMGTDIGITKFNTTTHIHQNYDHSNGIDGHPFYLNAIHQSSKTDQVFIGGFNGLVAFHPDSLIQNPIYEPIKITNILMNNQPMKSPEQIFENNEKIVVNSFEGSLQIQFSEMNYDFGGPNQYSYRLKNLDDHWINSGQNTSALFSYIPSGNYTFQVRSSTDGMIWSEPANIEIEILPKFHETWWFRTLAVLITIGLIPLGFIIRLNYLEKQKAKLQKLIDEKISEIQLKNEQITQKSDALVETNGKLKHALFQLQELEDQRIIFQENERQAISRELHDSISTTLFGIRMMVNKNKQEEDGYIRVPSEVDSLLGQVIRDSQIILNNLSTSFNKHTSFFDSLNDLVNQTKLISPASINLLWKGDDHIDELRLAANIFRIIQGALSNCIKHSNAKNINIRLINGESIHCEIEDDGVGFNLNTKDQRPGIQKMHKRAEEIDANLIISSTPGEGTLVILEVDHK